MEDLITAVMPALGTLFAAILTYVITRAAGAFTAATGIQIEARHREALHSALMTGATIALREGPKAALADLKRSAVIYARHSVPDAIRALVPGDGVLDDLAERYVMEAFARLGKQSA